MTAGPRLVLLPGLDGTGRLFGPFLRALPAGARAEVVALPTERLEYARLAERVAAAVALAPDVVLVAESFSGPLAARLAARAPARALVLVNTFVAPPVPGALAAPLRALVAGAAPGVFRARPPAFAVRRWLVGPGAPDALVAAVQDAVRRVPPGVLAHRLREVLRADAAADLARVAAPVLDLRGADDRLVGARSGLAVARAAGARLSRVVVPGPHLLLQARPVDAWRAIGDWLASAGRES